MADASDTLQQVTVALTIGDKSLAKSVLADSYPFVPQSKAKRSYTPQQSLEVFARDGFIDRYTGQRLVYPSVLYAVAAELPKSFPFGGGRNKSHRAHWELFPTVDHLVPVSRGGPDEMQNWVTTSMTTNMVKSSCTLEELGWELHPAGNLAEWDGLCSWYLEYATGHDYLASVQSNKGWHHAITRKFA